MPQTSPSGTRGAITPDARAMTPDARATTPSGPLESKPSFSLSRGMTMQSVRMGEGDIEVDLAEFRMETEQHHGLNRLHCTTGLMRSDV